MTTDGHKIYLEAVENAFGGEIEPENIAHGTGGLPLCHRCKELNAQGK